MALSGPRGKSSSYDSSLAKSDGLDDRLLQWIKPTMKLNPAATAVDAPCKICGADSPLFGVCDFNRSCEEGRGKFLPLSGIAIYYRRCSSCGLLFTEAFDRWAEDEFKAHIYNGGYAVVDPDFEDVRPT